MLCMSCLFPMALALSYPLISTNMLYFLQARLQQQSTAAKLSNQGGEVGSITGRVVVPAAPVVETYNCSQCHCNWPILFFEKLQGSGHYLTCMNCCQWVCFGLFVTDRLLIMVL
jgi:hypothetical protein